VIDNKTVPGLKPTRRAVIAGLLAGGASLLSGCGWDGHFTMFGYTTHPNYDENIRTVYVPIFTNKAFQTTPHRGFEMELTRAVIREIEATTPFKVVSDCNRADTELQGTIVNMAKWVQNRTQQNEIREGEIYLAVELVWRDLRTNEVLSNPPKPQGVLPAAELPRFGPEDANNPPIIAVIDRPQPAVIAYAGRFLPEVGESNASGQTRVCNQLAKQIAAMMEKNWQVAPRCQPPCP
jgi:Lipopolysaccharide-assembly